MEDYLKEHVLGKVFILHYCWREPEVVQVTGWTKTAAREHATVRYVYVRGINFNREHQDIYGGRGRIDMDTIKEITRPIGKPGDSKLMIVIEEGEEPFLCEGQPSSSIYKYYGLVEGEDKLKQVCNWGSID